MAYKRLWVLVEGNDDETFIERLKPLVENKYDFIHLWKYAQEPPKRTKNFLRALKAMNSDFFFLGDINHFPCVTARIDDIKNKYGPQIDTHHIIVVEKEIESWYLAGLDDKNCKELRIKTFRKTDTITKEIFNSLMPNEFDSRIDFMVEILKRFSVDIAMRKNKSFAYFMKKSLLISE